MLRWDVSKTWFVPLVLAFFVIDVLRHALTFSVGPTPLLLDARQYWEMGRWVQLGDLLVMNMPISYRTPGYGWFIGAFRSVFEDYSLFALVAAQHALVIGTSIVTAMTCYLLTGRRLAFLLGYGLSILSVTRAWHANVVLSETLFIFTLTWLLLAWWVYFRRPSVSTSIVLAIALGITIMVRPVPQLLCVPLVMAMLMNSLGKLSQVRFRVAGAHALTVVGVLSIVLGPWYYRNHALFGEWFLTKIPVENMWQVCFQAGSGANLRLPRVAATEELLESIGECGSDLEDRYSYAVMAKLRLAGLSDSEINRLVTDLCLAAIREQPFQFGYAAFKRLGNFWRCTVDEYPSYGRNAEPYFDGQHVWRSEFAARVFEPILRNTAARSLRLNELLLLSVTFGCVSLWLTPRTRMFAVSLVLVFAYFAAVTAALEMENYRYRMVLEPAMIVACVGGLLVRRQRQQEPMPSKTLDDQVSEEDSSGRFNSDGEYGTTEWESETTADRPVFELSNRL